ncbi:unnamed protein product [Clavelina lepadiformis]|uniref:Fibronectin type-III domain-containing protein n=1 Tax=Clavelina lepadiformis TaxID=159417 RepID=A0ABP0G0Y0_CLALP
MSKKLKIVKFTDNSTSLDVEPGNNYTISLSLLGGDSPKLEKTIHVSTKPSEPVYSLECSVNAIKLTWNHPEGFVENYLVQYISAQSIETKRLHSTMTSFIINNVQENTDYVIMLYSIIHDVNGNVERSTAAPKSCRTLQNVNKAASRKSRSAENLQGPSFDSSENNHPATSATPNSVMTASLVVGSLLLVLALFGGALIYRRKQRFPLLEDFPE